LLDETWCFGGSKNAGISTGRGGAFYHFFWGCICMDMGCMDGDYGAFFLFVAHMPLYTMVFVR
jgi:hypothetical protein